MNAQPQLQVFIIIFTFGVVYKVFLHDPKLLFMNRLFWNDIHHLLGLPVPSAYNFSTSRAESS